MPHLQFVQVFDMYWISVIQAQLVSADVEVYITAINSKFYRKDLPLMSLQVPPELIQLFAGNSGGEVRVISALHYNVEDVFPSGRPGINEYIS